MTIKLYRRSCYHFAGLLIIILLTGACADQPAPARRIGILQFTSRLDQMVDDFKQGLADLGYAKGEQVTYFYRNAEVNQDSLISHVQAMIDGEVDLIIAFTTPSAVVARKYTAGLDIPVIFSLVSDPVVAGLIDDMAYPGGNITGVVDAGTLIAPKRLEMLLELDPAIRRVLVLHSDTPSLLPGIDSLHAAAMLLGVELQSKQVTTIEEVAAAYEGVAPGDIDAAFVPSDALVIQGEDALVALLQKEHIPAIGDHGSDDYVFSFGPTIPSLARQTAVMAAKVLKGADPGTMPVELPRRYELRVSASVAEKVGYRIPDDAFRLADEVVR